MNYFTLGWDEDLGYYGDCAFHLASGLDVGKVMEIENVSLEFLELRERFSVFRLISMARQFFSSVTTWFIVGLLLEFEDTQAIAISTDFRAELELNSPFNLESITFLMSPRAIMVVAH